MYQRYGLQENPFGRNEALEQLTHFLTVEGFGEQKPVIDSLASSAIAKSHFFLIHGISGTGRTSVSNYVAYTLGSTPLMVVHLVRDSSHKDTLHEWMEAFAYKAAEVEGIVNISAYFTTVGDRAGATVIKYVSFLRKSLLELQPKQRRLVAIFENVTNPELFALAQEVFDPTVAPYPNFPLVIFTSSDETVRKGFANLNPKPAGPDPIQLRSLTGQDVLVYISQKWEKTGACQPHPFDAEMIVKAFDIQQYPMRRVIQALDSIFEQKLKSLPPGDDWPTDRRLAIGGEEIAMSLLAFGRKISS